MDFFLDNNSEMSFNFIGEKFQPLIDHWFHWIYMFFLRHDASLCPSPDP